MVMDVSERAGKPVRDREAASESGSATETANEGAGGPERTLRSGPPRPSLAALALTLVMVVSVGALFFGVFAFGLSGLQEQRSQHQLYATFRGLLDPSSPDAPWIGSKVPAGAPVALIERARSRPARRRRGPGDVGGRHAERSRASARHGAPRSVRRLGAPRPRRDGRRSLAHIADLKTRDVVTVQTGQGTFRFHVRGRLANGGKLPTIRATSGLLLLGTSARRARPFLAHSEPRPVRRGPARGQVGQSTAPARRTRLSATNLPGHNDPGAGRSCCSGREPSRGHGGVLVAVVVLGARPHVAHRRTGPLLHPLGAERRSDPPSPQRLLMLPDAMFPELHLNAHCLGEGSPDRNNRKGV